MKFINKFIKIEIFFFEEKNRILVNLLFSIKACQFKLVIEKVNKCRVQHRLLFFKITKELHYLIICLDELIFQYTCSLFDYSIIQMSRGKIVATGQKICLIIYRICKRCHVSPQFKGIPSCQKNPRHEADHPRICL